MPLLYPSLTLRCHALEAAGSVIQGHIEKHLLYTFLERTESQVEIDSWIWVHGTIPCFAEQILASECARRPSNLLTCQPLLLSKDVVGTGTRETGSHILDAQFLHSGRAYNANAFIQDPICHTSLRQPLQECYLTYVCEDTNVNSSP